jgi:tetratricopeptide (TPR) repeat protein
MHLPTREDVQRAVGDRYEVLTLAGAGGMGAVFTARHRTLGHIVAVKVLPPDIAASEMRQARFKREAALAASLSHPNIVPVYEFDSCAGITFLVMPFVRGRTLEEACGAGRRAELAMVLRLLREVGAALDFAHQRGVVHRDVKPSNILIEQDTGRALLADFGVAHVERIGDASLTATGAAIGTPDYMAPEQAMGAVADGRADLYSLALVAFEALTGTRPSLTTDRPALARALRAAQHQLSHAAAATLVLPLAADPDDRPASAAAWLAGLSGVRQRRTRIAQATLAALVVLAVGAYAVFRLRAHPPGRPTVAVMPFEVLRGPPDLPARQLTESFARRLSAAPNLAVLSGARVYTAATQRFGPGLLGNPQADSLARQLGASYLVQPSAVFSAGRVKVSAVLQDTASGTVSRADREGPVDSLAELMELVGEQVLRPLLRSGIGSGRTIPAGFDAIAAYFKADQAFRRGDYERARELYDRVLALAPDFAPAYFGRLLVVAQINPSEETLRRAIGRARRHQGGLEPADSLLLEGYARLLTQGDGHGALQLFKRAAVLAPDQPYVRFVLGEFYLFFGQLFDQSILEARDEFERVLDLDPRFAPAIANSISLAHLRGDEAETQRLIREYRKIDSTSVVADVVGIADTLLFGSGGARLRLITGTLELRSFTVLEYLAFQAAQFATPADSAVVRFAMRRILRALERRAADDYERALALRMGVAVDLSAGWPDSARARLARASPGTAARERDAWLVLARVAGLEPLGDSRAAAARLDAATTGRTDATVSWLLARHGPDPKRHERELRRLAEPDSAPLASSLALDLEAQRALTARDTARAIALWDRATRRYAVLSAPFDLVASLWPLRRDLARVASAHGDTTRAARACGTFDALVGFVDQAVRGEVRRTCAAGAR